MNTQMTSVLAQGNQTPVILQGVNHNNTLITKEVEFLGDSLLVVKDETNNKMYTGVGYICKGIGFSKGQKDRQLLNIQKDMVLNRGCLKFEAGVIDPNNEVLTIELDYLPIWLAKISITPKMKEQQSELVDRLVKYQLRAKDVLAKAFIYKEQALNQQPKQVKIDTKEKEIEARLINAKVRQANIYLKIAEKVNISTYKDICYSKAVEVLNGEVLLPLPKAERKTYSATEIGNKLGITANKVGTLANKHNLKTEDFGLMVWDKSKHSNKQVETFRYYESVIPEIKKYM